nr:MBL fold metallo-hydrolase [Thermoproteota archaeon]
VQIKGEKKNSINDYNTDKNSSSGNITFLFDTGVSKNGVVHNANTFEINFKQIDGIILSHGHFDHFTGLVNILKRISARLVLWLLIKKKLRSDPLRIYSRS